jgi:hypothetical protein
MRHDSRVVLQGKGGWARGVGTRSHTAAWGKCALWVYFDKAWVRFRGLGLEASCSDNPRMCPAVQVHEVVTPNVTRCDERVPRI